MDNCLLIDWFAVTFRKPGISVFDILELIGMPEDISFQEFPGRYYYAKRLTFGHINIYYDHYREENNFPLLEMSGQGCREFETFSKYGFEYLLNLVQDTENYHMSRIDIAYDDHAGILDIKKIMLDGFHQNYVGRSAVVTLIDEIRKHLNGFSLTTGSKSSDLYMRIYDKARERGFEDGRHWIRVELVLKQDNATNFIINEEPLGIKFRGVIHNYFRFVTPLKSDINKRRWKMRKYWSVFLDGAEKISVFSKKEVDYNLSRLHQYVFGQSGNSVYTYIKCVGLTNFIETLLTHDSKINKKQKMLIDECKHLYECGEVISDQVINDLKDKYKL